jgi:acetylornithine deacetylase
MTAIEKLLLDLLKIPSVSGREQKIGQFLVSKLGDFRVQEQFVEKDRFNVIARKGKSDVYIVVHMDTVPGTIPIKITKDKIFGRGTVDNKGNIAGAIMAAKKVNNINLLFTVGEEKDFSGAKRGAKIIGKNKAIVMEPTNLEIYSGQRGMITFEISTKGKQGHSAYANNKNNAIQKMSDILTDLKEKHLTAFNIGRIEGGIAANIVAPSAKAILSVRPETKEEFDSVLKKIKKYRILDKFPPHINSKVKGKIMKAFTEMAFYPNSFLFGAGDISLAHSENEYILRKDLNKLEEKLLESIALISKLKL